MPGCRRAGGRCARTRSTTGRTPVPGAGFAGDVVKGDGLLARQAVVQRHHQHPGFVVQHRHVQPAGGERQPGHQRVHPAVQQRRARLVPGHVLGTHVGVRMPLAQLPHRGGDDEARVVTHGDPAGAGGGAGLGRRGRRRAQQRPGPGQEDLPGLGEHGAPRGAVQQARPELLFQAPDLPAQGRLRDVQRLSGAAEVPVLGDGRTRTRTSWAGVRSTPPCSRTWRPATTSAGPAPDPRRLPGHPAAGSA